MNTVADLKDALCDHEDAGVALTIQGIIGDLVEKSVLSSDSILTPKNLELILMALHDDAKNPIDPLEMLAHTMIGNTPNTTEASLRYIEQLHRERTLETA